MLSTAMTPAGLGMATVVPTPLSTPAPPPATVVTMRPSPRMARMRLLAQSATKMLPLKSTEMPCTDENCAALPTPSA